MKALAEQIDEIDGVEVYGRVVGVRGLMVEVAGPIHAMSVGARVDDRDRRGNPIPCEVVGFSGGQRAADAVCAARGRAPRLPGRGFRAAGTFGRRAAGWAVSSMPGRADRRAGAVAGGAAPYPYPQPRRRRRTPGAGSASRSISGCGRSTPSSPCCRGQRMGIFAGSGVGKSVLLSMMARNVAADVSVIGLIGERGREVQEFLQDDLGEEGLARSVVVVSTSDEPALMRRQAAYLTLAHCRIFPRSGQGRAAADGFCHPLCGGAARDRPFRRRAADRERLYADCVFRTAAPPGAGRPGPEQAPSPAFSGAGRRRRPQRADR